MRVTLPLPPHQTWWTDPSPVVETQTFAESNLCSYHQRILLPPPKKSSLVGGGPGDVDPSRTEAEMYSGVVVLVYTLLQEAPFSCTPLMRRDAHLG